MTDEQKKYLDVLVAEYKIKFNQGIYSLDDLYPIHREKLEKMSNYNTRLPYETGCYLLNKGC